MTDATTVTREALASAAKTGRAPLGSPLYNEILEFLYEEAAALDQNRFQDWLGMLAKDLAYNAPLRVTRNLHDPVSDVVRSVQHFDEDYGSIAVRVMRLGTKSGWAEDPRSRTRRLVTNLRVETTDKADEFAATSYLLLTRSRFEEYNFHLMSAERRDIIRRVDGGFNLVKREILLDQSVLGMPNLAIFL
jgi:3-phenylpropionate/cinnamic acid dioxygenase small subunit